VQVDNRLYFSEKDVQIIRDENYEFRSTLMTAMDRVVKDYSEFSIDSALRRHEDAVKRHEVTLDELARRVEILEQTR